VGSPVSVEVQLENKLFRVKAWPHQPNRKPQNFTFKSAGSAKLAWDAVLEEINSDSVLGAGLDIS